MDIADTFFGLILKISKLCLNGYYYPFSICFKFNHANFSLSIFMYTLESKKT